MIIFPDVEPILVAHLTDALAEIGTPLATSVRVATKKADAAATQPAKQVVLTGGYTSQIETMIKAATVTVDVYANEYQTASELALLIGAIIVNVPKDQIKRAVVTLGPVRLSDEAPQEKRSMTVDLTVKGAAL